MLLSSLLNATFLSAGSKGVDVEQLLSKLLDWGIEVGKDLLGAIIIYIVGRFIIKQVGRLLARILEKRKLEISVQTFLRSLVSILLNLILAFAIVSRLGVETTSFAALLLLPVLLLVWLCLEISPTCRRIDYSGIQTFKVGDYIEGQNANGTVREIQIFHTIPDNCR